MVLGRLDEYLEFPEKEREKDKVKSSFSDSGEKINQKNLSQGKGDVLAGDECPKNLAPSYLVSVTYDGEKKAACLKLYEPNSKQIYLWYDNTGHQPYCFTNVSPEELQKMDRLISHPGFDRLETVEKYDALLDRRVTVTKIVAKDPLAIGGRASGCIRDIVPEEYVKIFGDSKQPKVWEAAIKYYQCYIFDLDLSPGMIYRIEDGNLVPVLYEEAEKTVDEILRNNFNDEPKDLFPYLRSWVRLLEYPAPEMRRIAIDIEVFSPVATRVPDADVADYPVICASTVSSDDERRVFLLKREDKKIDDYQLGILHDVSVEFYDTEKDLLSAIFKVLAEYPFVITFNGDDFDLKYLYHRAQKLGFKRSEVPIEPGREVYLLRRGVHIDLYKFFFNRSIQVYAFGQKYRNVTLDEISKAILGKRKIEISRPVADLSYKELAEYCFNDALITYELTSYNDDLVMKLILILTRISRMPMEDVSRQGVSRWIRSFMQYEHRRKCMLIPNQEDIIAVKGTTATKAIIKGKKYMGAIVVQPVAGVHFNVRVMDFQSLYPSIIKVYNLGYQSIRCGHEECRENKVPGTPHWICRRQRALESALIGSLRDLRVKWYKPKAKDPSLPKSQRNWYDVTQSALKVILNASYGVFGAETFDLYCPPVAEATAAIGRDVITQTIEKARELGIQVIYGDTDSIFLKNPTQEQIKALSEWCEKSLGMEIDVDKSYRYAVLSSRKKNYLGVLLDGTVDVKGLTGKKRHIPVLIKRFFDEMEERLSQVKTPGDFEEAKNDIEKIIRDCYNTIKRREWNSIDELAFEVVLGKLPRYYTKTTPQHVKAARLLRDRGVELKAGDIIRFVKVTKEPYVKPVELATDREIDVDKYVAYLQSTFDQVLDALGLEFEKIIGLTRLEQFI
ncbi:MAG: DNA-directed DNA polymerase I [Nitrososphaerota archaeon]|nr:DNA-directed DNA polymerase I [Candidatus Bathyarchaeota archaeon]MDW8049105.1 DNA-directed DNA polymerase I [Nitrososphaerota archaeon]